MKPEFSSATWKEGRGGFGSAGTPGALIGTTWHTQNIWLRREFALNGSSGKDIQLALHHDEDAEVFVNGILALKVDGYTSDYDLFDLNPAARASLKPSGNLLAIHCRQTAGGQYIDAGLVTTQPSHK